MRTEPPVAVVTQRDVAPVLVLGLGNLLLKDDGVGLELLRRLKARRGVATGAVDFVDGGTQGVSLLGQLCHRSALLILDAVSLGDRLPPGRVVVVRDPLAHPSAQAGGAHGANASGLLASAQLLGELPARAVVVGVSPAELATGIGLSEPVRAALPEALDRAEAVLAELCASLRREGMIHGGVVTCTS